MKRLMFGLSLLIVTLNVFASSELITIKDIVGNYNSLKDKNICIKGMVAYEPTLGLVIYDRSLKKHSMIDITPSELKALQIFKKSCKFPKGCTNITLCGYIDNTGSLHTERLITNKVK